MNNSKGFHCIIISNSLLSSISVPLLLIIILSTLPQESVGPKTLPKLHGPTLGDYLSIQSDFDTDSSDDDELNCLPTEISKLPKNDHLELMLTGSEDEWHSDSEKRDKYLQWYVRVSQRLMQNPVSYIASRPICGLKELFMKLKAKWAKHSQKQEHEQKHLNEQYMLERYTDETDRKILFAEGEEHSFGAQAKENLCYAFKMNREPEEFFIARMTKIGKEWQAKWAENFYWMRRKIQSFLHLFSNHSMAEHKQNKEKNAKKVFGEHLLLSPQKNFNLPEFFHKISTIFCVDKHTVKKIPKAQENEEHKTWESDSKRHRWEEFLDNLFHRKKHHHQGAHEQHQATNKNLKKLPSLNKREELTVLTSAGGILQMIDEKLAKVNDSKTVVAGVGNKPNRLVSEVHQRRKRENDPSLSATVVSCWIMSFIGALISGIVLGIMCAVLAASHGTVAFWTTVYVVKALFSLAICGSLFALLTVPSIWIINHHID